jgi:thiosulfate/3-mercaptopyruvate sulfurtransferase
MAEQLDTRREEVLVTADWLARNLDRPGLRIVDMRKGDGYQFSHIPGAVTHGGSPFLRENSDVIVAGSFAAMMSRLGVDERTLVVAYDDGNGLFAARLWWVAKYYGHAQVKVLDGGWDLWLAEGRPVSAAVTEVAATRFIARPQADWIASTDQVQAALGDTARVLLDVRGIDEWTRTTDGENVVAGHIPGAAHLVWSSVLDAATKRYLPGADLRRRFEAAGATSDREVITYCQGGIRAAHSMLALQLAGFERIRNYEGSWAAWSRSGLPIEPYVASAPDS